VKDLKPILCFVAIICLHLSELTLQLLGFKDSLTLVIARLGIAEDCYTPLTLLYIRMEFHIHPYVPVNPL